MDDFVLKQLGDIYGLNPNIPHLAFQFPRLPPGINHPIFKIHDNPSNKKFLQNTSSLNKKLDGFQKLYQQHASGLFTMNSSIVPPGHPLYSEKNSVEFLKAENDKLLKQNMELKKKLDKKTEK
ncbi:MAG: hypothetical protein R3237_04455 [Nitrosopumilaceae archaeon]|nr:hypothetical protein [Nitrosopumilaceae archaeon]